MWKRFSRWRFTLQGNMKLKRRLSLILGDHHKHSSKSSKEVRVFSTTIQYNQQVTHLSVLLLFKIRNGYRNVFPPVPSVCWLKLLIWSLIRHPSGLVHCLNYLGNRKINRYTHLLIYVLQFPLWSLFQYSLLNQVYYF